MYTESLFPGPERPARMVALGNRLQRLTQQGIWIGTSSWKYEGWLGSVYNRDRYLTRGRFSRKRFEETCLIEFTETFPIVCGDFSFYQFPSPDYLQRLFALTPAPFRFALKVPEFITVKRWPGHRRYGLRANQPNELFLNAQLLESQFLRPLTAFGEKVSLVIFEFGTFDKQDFDSVDEFVDQLDRFLMHVPRTCRIAVEIRNRDYLTAAHFQVLKHHDVAHVYNAWTHMPQLQEQITIADSRTAGFSVVRAMTRVGRNHEQAVKKFEPYESVKEPYLEARMAIQNLIHESRSAGQPAFVFVSNRLEGCSPGTIEAIVNQLGDV